MAFDDDLLEALGRGEAARTEELIAKADEAMAIVARQAAMLRARLAEAGLPDAVADACTTDYVGVLVRYSVHHR